jgi:hypothetical protein
LISVVGFFDLVEQETIIKQSRMGNKCNIGLLWRMTTSFANYEKKRPEESGLYSFNVFSS